jgi:uncharacterized protein (DUF433 family)
MDELGVGGIHYEVPTLNGYNRTARTERINEEALMSWQDRIVVDPTTLTGKPIIRGTRIAVEFIVELLAEGWTHEEIIRNYPSLIEEDLQAALHYAAEAVKRERVYPLAV